MHAKKLGIDFIHGYKVVHILEIHLQIAPQRFGDVSSKSPELRLHLRSLSQWFHEILRPLRRRQACVSKHSAGRSKRKPRDKVGRKRGVKDRLTACASIPPEANCLVLNSTPTDPLTNIKFPALMPCEKGRSNDGASRSANG